MATGTSSSSDGVPAQRDRKAAAGPAMPGAGSAAERPASPGGVTAAASEPPVESSRGERPDAVSRVIVITADDFGWTDGHNQAVRFGVEAGTLGRASLLCDERDNREAFSEAVAIGRAYPQLGVGVHLSLCEGRPLRPPETLPGLVRPDGSFHEGLGPLVGRYLARRLEVTAVEGEWRAQIERALRTGLRLSHLDGHKHVHVLPPLFDLAARLAEEYGVPYLRIPGEDATRDALLRGPAWVILAGLSARARQRLRKLAPMVQTADHFVGFGQSGGMTAEKLRQAIERARPGTTEIMLHPAVRTTSVTALGQRYGWARAYRFDDELRALRDPAVRAALDATRARAG